MLATGAFGSSDVATAGWTTRADVVATLGTRWRRGDFLTALAQGEPVVPQSVSLRGPSVRDVAGRFGEVQDWVRAWESVGTAGGIQLEYAPIGGRLIGANRLPVRARIDQEPLLWRLLGVSHEVAIFADLMTLTEADYPELVPWARVHPRQLLAAAPVWPRVLAVVRWIVEHAGPRIYLRQIDVPGVDTKFVEQNRALLGELLDAVLPPERIDGSCPRSRFAARYRFATKPSYVRLRRLDGSPLIAGWPIDGAGRAPSEMTLRVQELAGCTVPGHRAVIVENEITYLALPEIEDAVALLGGGYGVTRLAGIGWLADRTVDYWGDLDTHGFAILDQLRSVLPRARSLLMDRQTLEAHRDHWGVEAAPVNTRLARLTDPEQQLYRELVENVHADNLRLEQERVRFGAVRSALLSES